MEAKMATTQNVKKEKDTKTEAQVKPQKHTMAKFAYMFGDQGRWFKDIDAMTAAVLDEFKKIGVTKTIKNMPITPVNVKSLLKALMKDVVNNRKGVWAKYKVEENEKQGIRMCRR